MSDCISDAASAQGAALWGRGGMHCQEGSQQRLLSSCGRTALRGALPWLSLSATPSYTLRLMRIEVKSKLLTLPPL